jgi:hypothetical protein
MVGASAAAGEEVAQIARRSCADEKVPEEQWARVFAAFGPQLHAGREALVWAWWAC